MVSPVPDTTLNWNALRNGEGGIWIDNLILTEITSIFIAEVRVFKKFSLSVPEFKSLTTMQLNEEKTEA